VQVKVCRQGCAGEGVQARVCRRGCAGEDGWLGRAGEGMQVRGAGEGVQVKACRRGRHIT